jgi:DNA-directed RNA polymerase subunit RPC12/RpoP
MGSEDSGIAPEDPIPFVGVVYRKVIAVTDGNAESVDGVDFVASSEGLGPPPSETFGLRSNRRVKASKALLRCRVCWRPITIEPPCIEVESLHVYLRCPNCGHSFPIRREDVQAIDSLTVSKIEESD